MLEPQKSLQKTLRTLLSALLLTSLGCGNTTGQESPSLQISTQEVNVQDERANPLSKAAVSLTKDKVRYDPSYFSIDYPGGDVPADVGVCTDVVIRAYRKIGIDLQVKVHEDMKANFKLYPKLWGLKHCDRNIDHRRVPNLMTFFTRHGEELEKSNSADDYLPGDIVCWNLGGAITHIGIVIDAQSTFGNTPLIVHNIGAGQVKQDCLFDYEIIGHYRYDGD